MSNLTNDLASRLAAEDTVVRMFVATDEQDWPTLDMTSLLGGRPTAMMPRQVANAWAEGFKPLDHAHHQIGNLRTTVQGTNALVRCYGVALHHRMGVTQGFRTRLFVGTYELKLVAGAAHWRISELKFKLKFIDGNLELEKSA